MAPPSDKTNDLERRVSARTSARISLDAVDEDHDLALGGMVSDGFRPRGMSTPSLTSGSSTLVPDDSPASSSRTDRPTTTPKIQMALRSSSPHDGPTKLARRATNSTESTQSTIYYPRDGPYQGPSAPSHPYQMYPQNVRPARTMSTVTSSTVPPSESSYNGPRGPSHPYALYPQADSTGVELDADAVRPDAIPLGFHGLPDQYRRRAGPDGDDIGDIIGPDGHTEQLPPYTRYPDEAYARKAAAMDGTIDPAPGGASIVPPIQTAPASAVLTIPGAGGIGLATRNPEFESTDDLGSPRSRHSTRSFASDDSQRRINMDEGVSEKGSPPKKWQLWMRRKLCGVVPYWALCLTGVVLVIMAIVLGAAIGVFLGQQKKPPPGHRDGTWEPTFDTWPTTAPPDLQPLPTGTYSVPLMAVSTSSNTCFLDPSMSQAWNCLVSSGLQMTISKDDHNYLASLNSNHSYTLASYVYSYGEQPPTIPRPVPLELVSDRSEPNRGPAWYKMLSYNKTVILPEGWLSVPNSQRRARHLDPPIDGISAFKRKGIAQPGEKPWVCNWPDTYLELFIYAQQNITSPNWPNTWWSSSSTESSSTTTAISSSTTTTTTPVNARAEVNPTPPWWTKGNWPEHNPESGPPMTQTPTSSSTTYSSSSSTTTTSSSSAFTTTATPTGPFGPIDTGDDFPMPPARYPKVVKLEERRISTAGAPRARCTQVEIQAPGQEARVVRDRDGIPVVVDIQETEAVLPPGAPTPAPDLARRSPSDVSPCACIWYLT